MKSDFPLLKQKIDGYPLRYLDTASTSQKPQSVIDAMAHFYSFHNANVGRSVYHLAEDATRMYENARTKVAQFIGAQHQEVIFTSGCTESINYVASSWAINILRPGDEIVLTELEHHANIVPWQRVSQKKGALLKYIPIHADGTLDFSNLDRIITSATRLVSFTLVSNALGTHVDPQPLIDLAQYVGAKILIDASQAIAHQAIDVRLLQCDFLAFSGHKMLGPTGIGVLYIKKEVQKEVEPYQLGGGMISKVSFFESEYLDSVERFEAGTPPIAQAIGLAAAVGYLQSIDMQELKKYEAELCRLAIEGLQGVHRLSILGPTQQLQKEGHLVSFTLDGIHSHDMASFLAAQGICVRAGTLCASPLFSKLGLPQGAVRASFYGYTTLEDVEALVDVVREATIRF